MPLTLPIEVYEAFEEGLGYEESKRVVKAFETAISDITDYKWHTNKEEILSEVRKEFSEVRKEFSEVRKEFSEVRKETDRKFSEMDRKFSEMDKKFTELIEKKFSEVDKKFSELIEKKFSEVDKKFATKSDMALLEGRMNERFTRIEAKMDVESKRVDGEFKAMRLEMKIFFLLIALLILATTPRALDMIAKVFGLVK
ncbi:MAG: hypothetical protein HQL03_06830 [Nitrospirae bacterium]|nr:hypothetical protein [Nitrospirota bacterium]MBF0592790.1 hypothetical protein [Nitrospirota bacterium]